MAARRPAGTGQNRWSILTRPPSPTVAAAVGAQYYWILHYHPVALLGYVATLEGTLPTVELLDDLVDRTVTTERPTEPYSLTPESTPGIETSSTRSWTVCS